MRARLQATGRAAPRSVAAPAFGRGAVAVAVLGAVLAGCGFRLAGSQPLPVRLAHPYLSLQDPYTDFSREFERELRNAGAELRPAGAAASAVIDVSKDSVEQRVLSVSARNIPTEYLLVYTVTFSVSADGRELMAPQTLSLSQDYTFAEQAVLAKEHESDVLRLQMARNLAAIAMRRLSSLK